MKSILLFTALLTSLTLAAQFPTNNGVQATDPGILGWAEAPQIERGLQQEDSLQLGPADTGSALDGAGVADLVVVSLGEAGIATYVFDPPLADGPGWDVAIYENGFASGNGFFLELALVEISSDGENFVRFPAESLTDTSNQLSTFDLLQPNRLYGLAGKYEGLVGTPFDFAQLSDSGGLNPMAVSHLRIIDVVGRLDQPTRDINDRPINDPWPTPFGSSGFDLDAVAYRYLGTNNLSNRTSRRTDISVYPNPARPGQILHIQGIPSEALIDLDFRWSDTNGKRMRAGTHANLQAPQQPGIYRLWVFDPSAGNMPISEIIILVAEPGY